MNSLNNIFFVLALLILQTSCTKDQITPIVDPAIDIAFQIEQTNSSENYISNVKSMVLKKKSAGWRLNPDEKTQLTREITFDLELENGNIVEFGLWFIKYETDQSQLILEDENLNSWGRNWDYTSAEVEAVNFYQEFDEARILLNNNVIFHHEINTDFNVIKVEEALVNGSEKSYVTINFSGNAYGWYDPSGVFQEVYRITNGEFKGVIE